MNKIKILPLLLIFPVLASCSGKLKAPTFADYGEKQNFTSFSEALASAIDESVFSKEDLVKSLEIKYNRQTVVDAESKRNDKTVEITNSSGSVIQTEKYDSNNKLYDITVSTANNYKVKSSYGKGSSSESEAREVMYQAKEVDGKNYVLSVDKTRKEYSKYAEIEAPLTIENVLDTVAKTSVRGLVNRFTLNIPSQAEAEAENSKYSLYVNGKIFTITYNDEETEEIKNADEVLQCSIVTKVGKIYQLDLTDYKWAYKSKTESSKVTTYHMTYDTHILGDTISQVQNGFENSWAVEKEIKLKPTNLDKYTRVSFQFEYNSKGRVRNSTFLISKETFTFCLLNNLVETIFIQ